MSPALKGATPFNILPTMLAHYGSLIELTAILPSSPLDFSHGWVRPRHTAGKAPSINFYSEENAKYLLKGFLFPDTQCTIFFAKNQFSYPIIEKFARQAPCIIVTDNLAMSTYFKGKKGFNVIDYKTDDSLNKIFSDCYPILVEVFVDKGEKSLSGKPISKSFVESFCLKKDFLPKTRVSNNFLCIASEIVMSQARGKFPRLLDFNECPYLDNDAAFELNVELMDEILSERLVDILLGVENNEHVFEPKKIPPILHKWIKKFNTDFPQMSMDTKKRKYSELKQIALSEITNVFSRNEVTLVIPTVNLTCRKHLIVELQKRIPAGDRDKLQYLVDNILAGGRGLAVELDKLSKPIKDLLPEIKNTRLFENRFLTYLVALFASRKLSPVLKAPTAPSSLFLDIIKLRACVHSGYLSQSQNIKWCLTTGERFAAIQQRLTDNIPKIYLHSLNAIKPSSIVIFSDLPFELSQFENGMAICQTFPTTRVPITPMSSMFNYLNLASQMGAVFVEGDFLKNVLFLNSLHEKDPAHLEYEAFIETCEKIGLHFKAVTVVNRKEFISSINEHKPSILVYFGHGLYNEQNDMGELVLKEDRFSLDNLGEINAVPRIVFLIGCETASCSAFFGGLPAHLLGIGVFSIVASIFPIPGEVAGSFLGRVLSFIDDITKGGVSQDFSAIVFGARKLGWVMDNLNFLLKIGAISYNEMGEILMETSKSAMDLSTEKGYSIPLSEAVEIFKCALYKHKVLDDWEKNRKYIVPYSLFFTLLGDSSNVMFGGSSSALSN